MISYVSNFIPHGSQFCKLDGENSAHSYKCQLLGSTSYDKYSLIKMTKDSIVIETGSV